MAPRSVLASSSCQYRPTGAPWNVTATGIAVEVTGSGSAGAVGAGVGRRRAGRGRRGNVERGPVEGSAAEPLRDVLRQGSVGGRRCQGVAELTGLPRS